MYGKRLYEESGGADDLCGSWTSDRTCNPYSVCETESLCGKTNGRYKNDVAEAKREKQVFFIDSRIGERRMEEKSRYEEMYGKLVAYEQNIHLQNQKRIKIGLKCIAIIPPIFLILLFWTDSNKVVFLILWIVSLFALATYLILVEYVDYNLQEKLNELRDEEDKAVDVLMGKQLDEVEENIKNAIQKLDEKFNSEAEIPKITENDTKEKTE